MKTIKIIQMRPGIIIGSIIALIILLCHGEPGYAARIAGTDDNVNTTTSPADTIKQMIKASPVSPGRQDVPATRETIAPVQEKEKEAAPAIETPDTALQTKGVKTEEVIKPAEDNQKETAQEDAKQPAHHAQKKASQKYVTLDFDNVEIGVLVKFVSELTGKNFLIDDKVKGKITILSPKKIPVEDVYKVFLSVLEINGFTVVPSGNIIKIIPVSLAKEKSLETRTKKELASPEDRMVTQIVALERANPDEIKRILDPIISKTSSVLSYPPAGILVITDYLSNIRRLQEIIAALDVEGAGNQISYIHLVNASASEVVKSLTAIFQQSQRGKTSATDIKVVSDSRTNSLIILASVADTESVRKLIAFMDKDVPRGESNIQVYRLQNSNAEDLAKVLNSIIKDSGSAGSAAAGQKVAAPVVSKDVHIVADKATNTLVVMAEREDYKIIENIIKQLDVSRPMVYIEALIMEVNTNKAFNLGVEWRGLKDTGKISGVDTGQSAAFIGSGGAGSTTDPGSYNILGGLTPSAFPSGFTMGIVGAGITIGGITFPNIGAVVQAYKTDTDVSILSTPQVMTLDNEEAEINVGSNVPYITRQDSTTTTSAYPVNYNTYEYKDVGVILNITPHINEENYIRLKISQQVTKVTSASSSATPTTLKRTTKTTVVVKDSETIVISGLMGDSTQDTTYKVPFLGDIPILGWLFKTYSTSREKTNLYVFLTPHIVRTQADAAGLYQEKRETMGEVVEGIIKLDEKKSEPKPYIAPIPAGGKTPAKP
jgi:general secretion pathway protein D